MNTGSQRGLPFVPARDRPYDGSRLLDLIDEQAPRLAESVAPPERDRPTAIPDSPRLALDLARGEVRTILWATGYRPDYRWLKVPVLDRKGQIDHDGGVTASPGLFAMGLPFMRRRKSTLIDGAGDDARDLADRLGRGARHRRDRP